MASCEVPPTALWVGQGLQKNYKTCSPIDSPFLEKISVKKTDHLDVLQTWNPGVRFFWVHFGL